MKPERIGRFDQSFVVLMIRDFALVLLLVVVAELGLRLALAYWDFEHRARAETERAAAGLAADIRAIMLNSGGPVAARTFYPILKRNHRDLGLLIAVEPSAVTVASIKQMFGTTPRGIPPDWPPGRHHEATREIRAEAFCLTCHARAGLGDVLGRVVVRDYFAGHLSKWWAEVRLTGLFGLIKILLHTTVLFFLLKIRMEPLLALRSAVAGLAKAGSTLSLRAQVKSHDEFGELARDLNLFLDRISHIVEDLSSVLAKVANVNSRLGQVQGRMEAGLDELSGALNTAAGGVIERPGGDPLLSGGVLESVRVIAGLLEQLVGDHVLAPDIARQFSRLDERLSEVAAAIGEIRQARLDSGRALSLLSDKTRAFSHFIAEMAVLEEKMQAIAELGQTLVSRLQKPVPGGGG